jgi:hypothetical protein
VTTRGAALLPAALGLLMSAIGFESGVPACDFVGIVLTALAVGMAINATYVDNRAPSQPASSDHGHLLETRTGDSDQSIAPGDRGRVPIARVGEATLAAEPTTSDH